jgi:hypothetical protein
MGGVARAAPDTYYLDGSGLYDARDGARTLNLVVPLDSYVFGLVVDRDSVYLSAITALSPECDGPHVSVGAPEGVLAWRKYDGPLTVLAADFASSYADPGSSIVDGGDALYLTDGNALRLVTKADGARTTIATAGDATQIEAIAVDAAYVYWSSGASIYRTMKPIVAVVVP